MHILLIEDDHLVGEGIRNGLEVAGFTVDWVTSMSDAELALNALDSDLVVLDRGLPDGDGLALLRQWRDGGAVIPVLILTARDAVDERVAGLQGGADDYLLKPFDLDELIARIHALLRRVTGRAGHLIRHGSITLDPVARIVTREGVEVDLTRREFMLLQKLLYNPRSIVGTEQLKDSLYGLDGEVESNAISVHVHNLRHKLGHDLIRTVRGQGYRLAKPD